MFQQQHPEDALRIHDCQQAAASMQFSEKCLQYKSGQNGSVENMQGSVQSQHQLKTCCQLQHVECKQRLLKQQIQH